MVSAYRLTVAANNGSERHLERSAASDDEGVQSESSAAAERAAQGIHTRALSDGRGLG